MHFLIESSPIYLAGLKKSRRREGSYFNLFWNLIVVNTRTSLELYRTKELSNDKTCDSRSYTHRKKESSLLCFYFLGLNLTLCQVDGKFLSVTNPAISPRFSQFSKSPF